MNGWMGVRTDGWMHGERDGKRLKDKGGREGGNESITSNKPGYIIM